MGGMAGHTGPGRGVKGSGDCPTLALGSTRGTSMKDDIIASVVGCDLCHAEGHTVKHPAPILAMCRHLVEAGYDPKRPLLAFRGSELAMHVKSIGYGAHYVAYPRTAKGNPNRKTG